SGLDLTSQRRVAQPVDPVRISGRFVQSEAKTLIPGRDGRVNELERRCRGQRCRCKRDAVRRSRGGHTAWYLPTTAEVDRPQRFIKHGLPILEQCDARSLCHEPHLRPALVEESRPPLAGCLSVSKRVARFECQQLTYRVGLGALDATVRQPPKTREHSFLQRRQVPRRDWHTKIERVDGQSCQEI